MSWLDWRLPFANAAAFAGVPSQLGGPGDDGEHYVGAGARIEPPAAKTIPNWEAKGVPGSSSFDAVTSTRTSSLSDEFSDVYTNADGSHTVRQAAGRLNYRDSQGVLRPIDTNLVRGGNGRLRVAGSDLGVSLWAPEKVDGPTGFMTGEGGEVAAAGAAGPLSDELAALTLPGGQVVAYGLQGAVAVAPQVQGDTATYTNILPQIDVRMVALETGLKEHLVLKDRTSPREFVFPLRLQGLTAQLAVDGSLEFVDSTGAVAVEVPRGFMYDSAPVDATGEHRKSYEVSYSLTTVDGAVAVRVTAGSAWLDDPARVWPVTLDPTLYVNDAHDMADVYVDSEASTHESDQNGTSLAVGRWSSGGIARSFIAFHDFDEQFFVNKQITAARLRVYLTWANTCNTYEDFFVHRVTSSWSVDALDDANLAASPSYSAPIGTLRITDHSPACTNTAGNRSVGEWHWVTLDPATFHDWATLRGLGDWDEGLALTASETSNTSWKRFTSANYGATYKPYLELTFADNIAPQVSDLFPPDGATLPTLTPELAADGYDPDGFPATLNYSFVVYEESETGVQTQIAASGWIESKTWTVPTGVLKWGGRYRWDVRTHDGPAHAGSASYDWGPMFRWAFTTPVPQGLITSTLGSNGRAGFAPDSGSYTTEAIDAQVSSVGPALEITRSYHSLDPRTAGAFGAGWSSLVDMAAKERLNVAGTAVVTVEVAYPTGQTVTYGKNADGTYSAGLGRYAIFTAVAGGYQLVDKDGTKYLFTTSAGTGNYALTSVTDVYGRVLNLTYTAGQVTRLTSATSGRNLHITWTGAHVSSVATDEAVLGNPSTVATWSYTYTGDQLTKVCPPTSATLCTTYSYVDANLFPATVENLDPYSYWRLGESTGSQAGSQVLERMGVDVGTHTDTVPGQPGPLTGSTATATAFNGASSSVALPAKAASRSGYQTVSMWFNASALTDQVLYGQSWDPLTTSSTNSPYHPLLYMGSNGQLYGGFPTLAATGPLGSLLGAASGRCVDSESNGNANGRKIWLYDCNGTGSQQWTLTATGELRFTHGAYTRCLQEQGTESGAKLVVWDCNGSAAQRWRMTGDGRIMSQESGQCADVNNAALTNGSEIVMWHCYPQYYAHQTFTPRTRAAMNTSAPLTAGAWYHVVLTAAGDRQAMYLNGSLVASQTGVIIADILARYQHIGAGFLGGGWPNQSHVDANKYTGVPDWFNGSISDVAVFDRPLTGDLVAELYGARTPRKVLSQVTRPSGGLTAAIAYDTVSGKVAQVTDADNGIWKLNPPVVKGSSRVYASSVLGGAPADYWRLADRPGATVPLNQINASVAMSDGPVLGGTFGADGPFPDTIAPLFDGIDDSIVASGPSIGTAGSFTVSTWANMSNNAVTRQAVSVAGTNAAAFSLGYDKASNKWAASMCQTDTAGATCPKVTSGAVAAVAAWTHLAASFDAPTKTLRLYVSGSLQGSVVFAGTPWNAAGPLAIGKGRCGGADCDRWAGRIAEVATFRSRLSDQQIGNQYTVGNEYRTNPTSVAMPAKVVFITDPANKVSTQVYSLRSGQQIAVTDTLGNLSQFGYDLASGAMTLTVDPNGNKTEFVRDVRGNVLEQSTWQNQLQEATKSTTRFTYYPDATTKFPVSDPRNDKLLTVRDARSSGPADNTYLTTNAYNTAGHLIEEIDPLGRRASTTYTDGTGGIPAGLVSARTEPGGGITTTTYLVSGDIDTVTDPAGKVTQFTYDRLGRPLTQKVTTSIYPTGVTTSFTYDLQNRILSMSEPASTNRVTGVVHTTVTTNVYNPDGQTTSISVSDSTGGDATRTEVVAYNTLGQKGSHTDASNKTTTYIYDIYGQVLRTTDPAGTVLETVRDSEGQLLTSVFKDFTGDPDSPSAPVNVTSQSRVYDLGGRLVANTDAMGWVTEYDYTANNLLTKISRVNGANRFVVENNTYDKAGNLTQQITNDGATTTTFVLDAASRPTSSTVDPAGLNRTTSVRYTAADQVASVTVKDNTATYARTEAVYDNAGRLLSNVTYTGSGLAPAARWLLNESAGNTAADSVGNAAASGSNVSWSPDHGGSAVFNGSSSVFRTGGPIVDTTQDVTFAVWVKPNATGVTGNIIGQDGVRQNAFELRQDYSNKWMLVMRSADVDNPATIFTAASSSAPAVGVWTHLAGVFNATAKTMTLYVDGTAQATVSNVVAWPAGGPLTIGCGKWNGACGGFFNGSIDDVQVYQQALTSGEVSQIHSGAAQEQNWSGYRDYASGDFNADGKADLVAIRIADGVLVRWSGNGDGTFTYAGNVGGGWSTFKELISADFNNDGKPDLMALSTADNKLRRWFGLGSAVFGPAQDVSTGWTGMTNMVTAEFNSDGKADLVGIDSTNGNLRCYTGDGLGGISSSSTCGGGWTSFRELIAGDFNVDGKADLMAINASNTLHRWNGNGALGFATAVSIGTGWTGFHDLVSGDFNTDAKRDFYVVRPDSAFGRYHNNGSGGFNNAGDLSGVTGSFPDPASQVSRTSYVRDQSGAVVAQTDPNGNVTNFEYDQAGQMSVVTRPTVTTEQHGSSPVVTMPVTYLGYNTFGERTEVKDALGRITTTGYDANGRDVSTTYPSYTPPGSPTPIIPVVSRQYDAVGQLTKVIDPRNYETTYVYDMLGRVTKQTNPDGGVTRYTYDLVGDVLSMTDPIGATKMATYDYLGRQLTGTEIVRQTSSNHITTYTYGVGGHLSMLQSPDGVQTRYFYNAAGDVTSTIDGANNTTTYQYDGAQRPIRTTLADNTYTTTSYDLAGRALSRKAFDAAGLIQQTTSASYDRNGNMASITDGRGTTQTFVYDATNLLTSQTEPVTGSEDIVSTFGYDLAGQPTRFTDGRNNAFWTTYNQLGLVESQIEPATAAHPNLADRTFTTAYNAAGVPVSQTLPGGVSQAHTYDAVGRLTGSTGSGAQQPTDARAFGYDLAGRITSLSGSGGTNTLTWDDRGLPLTVTGPSGDNTFTYTADGLMKTRADAAGTTTYGYDTAGRLASMSNPTTGVQVAVGYNNLSQQSQLTYGTNQNRRVFGYDNLHRLTSDELKTSGGTSIGKISYGYDQNSNLTSKTTTGFAGAAINTYTYDLANRLTSWNNAGTTTNYAYDKSGNRTSVGARTFTYDERNRLLASPSDGTSYQYTPRGTLASSTTGTVTRATHTDAFDQVIRQYTTDTAYETYSYDGLGRAIKPGFGYTGLGNDLAGDGVATYTRDPAGDLIGVKQGASSVLAWTDIHTDLVGQFTATGTTLTGSKAFDPLGKQIAAATPVGNLGFQQEFTESSTGRVNMHARWYNPDTGQFDTRDSWTLSARGNSANANRYGYANANPFSGTDPSGHEIIENCSGIFKCLIKGFINSFNVVKMVTTLWKAFTNLGETLRKAWNNAKASAKQWRIRIENHVRDSVNCNSMTMKMLTLGKCSDVIEYGSIIGGVACTINDLCQTLYDCQDVLKGNVRNQCAETVGAMLADAVMALISLGAGAALKTVTTRLAKLFKDFKLPNRRDNNDPKKDNGNGNDGGSKKDPDSDIKSEKDYMRDHPTKPSKKGPDKRCTGSKCKPKPTKPNSNKPSKPPVDNGPRHDSKIGNCQRHSFDPSTRVLMADGSTKPIGDIKLGDKVLATDPETGHTSAQSVVALHENLDTELADITVSTAPAGADGKTGGEGDGDKSTRGPTKSVLHTTQNHPFWDATTKQWVDASELEPGKSKLIGPNGETQKVLAARNYTGERVMNDLTVDKIHTYYVISNGDPVLVHNNNDDDPMRQIGPGVQTHADEWSEHLDFARSVGVEIRERPGGLWYAPGNSPGQPGQLTIDPDASISALRHEMSHLRDDMDAGWGGFRLAYDRDFLWASEFKAYMTEVSYARSLGRYDLARSLIDLARQRKSDVYSGC